MARAGGRAGKVLSSGRLTGPVRLSATKKRAAVRKVSTTSAESGYSLCSTDSEDQVLVINKGLDRCAALLQDILQSDVIETTQQSSNRGPTPNVNTRSSTMKLKKSFPRKPTTASHVRKEIATLRKSAPHGLSDAGKVKPCGSTDTRKALQSPALQTALCEHVQTQMSRLNEPASQPNCNGTLTIPAQKVSEQGPESGTLFNCRLPSSTPALSPQHPSSSLNSGHEGYSQCLPQGGAAHYPSGCITTAAHQLMSYVPAPGQLNAAASTCYQPPYQADMLSQLRNSENPIKESDLLKHLAAHLTQLQRSETSGLKFQNHKPEDVSETETDETSSEEDDGSSLDFAPVREASCQTSFDNNIFKPRRSSPEKMEKKIKTVKYLLGEIKALVADQDGGEALRLITELEQTVSVLPAVVGSTNVHAEIALALQPLRSENAQLRRRLRILNQQLRDRERAEKASRTDDENYELTSLQSMNMTLQHQLNESQRSIESLQSKNEELLNIMEVQKEENLKFARVIQEKELELMQIRQQNEIAATKVKIDVDDAFGKMKSVQFKLEASEKENQILGITLRQRDAEVSRLRDLTRTLQASMAKLLTDLSKDNGKSKSGNSLTKSMLDSYEKQLQSDQCPASSTIMSYLKKLETDQVFPHTDTIFIDKPVPSKTCGNILTPDINEDFAVNKGIDISNQNKYSHLENPQRPSYIPEKHRTVAESESGTLTGEEFKPDETTYLPLASSPYRGQFVTMGRQNCTPPKAVMASRVYETSSPHAKLGEFRASKDSKFDLDQEFGFKPILSNVPMSPDRSSKRSERISNIEHCPQRIFSADAASDGRPPLLQQMKNLQLRDPNDYSTVDFMCGKSDWSMTSFSTFTTHDEQDFRNGLAALDANIAKLQRTLQTAVTRK
ncbi:coiled-coil domain-containing protein 14 [Discoglossus pictus]